MVHTDQRQGNTIPAVAQQTLDRVLAMVRGQDAPIPAQASSSSALPPQRKVPPCDDSSDDETAEEDPESQSPHSRAMAALVKRQKLDSLSLACKILTDDVWNKSDYFGATPEY